MIFPRSQGDFSAFPTRKEKGVSTNYTLNGKNIVHMTQGSNDLHFFYDAQGKPAMVHFNGGDYFYVYNLQGDVVAMIDANGTQVVEYYYDAWGAPISRTGTMAATLGTVNPFRYRGYVYDEETGLYYLRSRYYNPVWKRFINADVLTGKIGSIFSHNLYSYTLCNPVNRCDFTGTSSMRASAMQIEEVENLFDKVGFKLPEGTINLISIRPVKYDEYDHCMITVTIIANEVVTPDMQMYEAYSYSIYKKHTGFSNFIDENIAKSSTFANFSDTVSSMNLMGNEVLIGFGNLGMIPMAVVKLWEKLPDALNLLSAVCDIYTGLDEYTGEKGSAFEYTFKNGFINSIKPIPFN